MRGVWHFGTHAASHSPRVTHLCHCRLQVCAPFHPHSPRNGLILKLFPNPGPFAPARPPRTDKPCWRKGSRAQPAPAKPHGPYLVIQHEQQSAFHIDVTGTLHLEAVSLLGCGQPVPL